MAKCNKIISKRMLYDDNDDKHKGSNTDSEVKSRLETPYSPV